MRLGIIARSDSTGLGNQTRELVKMLNPNKVLLIDSSPFNNNTQHAEWYSGYNTIESLGFPNKNICIDFLNDLDVVISCELFYHPQFVKLAKKRNIKTILQYNYEFLDYLNDESLQLPDLLISPSTWEIDTVIRKFGQNTKVLHLPPPIDKNIFENIKNNNMKKTHKKILHIAGLRAVKDRNGTDTVIEMLKYSNADYELVIKSQTGFTSNSTDPRLTIDFSNPENNTEMYDGFDAMVLPRRYAGLCLPMNEALMSGLPVMMTDIAPNNAVLPSEWLVEARKVDQLMTRTMIDVYSADPRKLAALIDNYINSDIGNQKKKAYEIALQHFDMNMLRDKYLDIIQNVIN
jgi:glycosyltransferase involved in cell wall biosynthesis